MLRLLRVFAVIVFAILIGLSANSLLKMHENGDLLEKYNSGRKANITLLGVSILALGALGYFEISSLQRNNRRRFYGDTHFKSDAEEETAGLDSTSIYAAPHQVDEWKGRRTKSSRAYNEVPKMSEGIWMSILRVFSTVLPVVYVALLTCSLIIQPADAFLAILLPSLAALLLILSVFAALGISRKKPWGLTMGYILALCNLVIFPYGTAVGLFLILALVGSSQSFADSAIEKRRKARRRGAPRSRVAAI